MSSIAQKYEKKYENAEEIFDEMRKYLDTSLMQLVEAFEKHNLKWHLDSGTLLGAYRDGTSLTKDSDHDVSITIEELMSPNGRAFLKEFAPNFARSKRSTKSTVDGERIQVFTDAETLLRDIESNEPFVMTNLGWEALFDGDVYKYKSHTRRVEHKIDVFIQYPWHAVTNGLWMYPEGNGHHVYPLPFFGEHFCKMPSWQLQGVSQPVDVKYETFDSIFVGHLPGYHNIQKYLLSIFGEGWETPTSKYKWHGRKTYLETKIFTKELFNNSILTTLDIENEYKFDPAIVVAEQMNNLILNS